MSPSFLPSLFLSPSSSSLHLSSRHCSAKDIRALKFPSRVVLHGTRFMLRLLTCSGNPCSPGRLSIKTRSGK
ncbi:hypothetical protein E2C01_101815 [Portunus trituberculatus]|uniref:Uncharacterized protein n=1 Tax=Portunus trituberculatus TaxID=210409 RepID=A0A5B7KGP6_PORTR|nr:hypothetical protein [Portunus trituberculatus]